MLHLMVLTLLLAFTRFTVRAAPLRERDIFDPFDPLKSVASELLGFTTAFAGPAPTSEPAVATITAFSTDTPQSSAAPVQTSAAQSGLESSSISETTGSSEAAGITVSSTVTQISAGVFSATSQSILDLSRTVATASASPLTTAPGESSGTVAVVPTTTGDGSASSTGTSSTSSSSSSSSFVPGSVSSPGSGSPGSGSDPDSGSSSASADPTSSPSLSSGEIAAAVLLPILALIALLFLLFRYNKPLRERYSTWRQQSLERSAYRRALDDPVLSFGTMREEGNPGLGMGDVEQLVRPQRPLSFGFSSPRRPFPKQTRKPLGWDATRVGGKTASAIGMAVPMPVGQHSRSVSEISDDSDIYGGDERPGSRYEDARSNQALPGEVVS